MPTVPIYQQQIEDKPLPGVRQDSVATPTLLGSAGDSAQNLGKGVSDAGVGIAAIGYQMQERQDMTAILQVETARKEAMVAADADMRKNRQGGNAAGVTQDVKKWWDDAAREDLAALQTDNQRDIYKRRLAATRLSNLHSASQFEAQQSDQYLGDTTKAAVTAAINTAAANAINTATGKPDEVGIALQREAITTALAALAKRRGEDKKGPNGEASPLEVATSEAITRMHKEVLQALPPEQARDYFLAHEQEIDGSQRDAIGKAARKETADAVGQKAAKEEIAAAGGYGAGIDVILERLDQRFGTDTVTLKAAHAAAKDMVAAFEHGEQTRMQKGMAAVNSRLLNGETWATVKAGPEYKDLLYNQGPKGVEAAQKIEEHQLSLEATRASRAASLASRSYTEAAHRQIDLGIKGMNSYLDLVMNPDKLAGMTSDQVINLRTEMSDQQVQHLAGMQVQLTKSADALAAAKLDANTFKLVTRDVGLPVDKPPKDISDEDKARIEKLQMAASNALSAANKAKGRPITDPQERYDVVKKAVFDMVRVPGFFNVGGYGSGTDVPVSTLTPDEMKSAMVIVPEGRVRLADIPPEFRVRAQREYDAAGRTLTQSQLARAWLLNRNSSTGKIKQ